MQNRGLFITIEGGEGVGKSTALTFLHNYLQQKALKFIITREPGGTPIAEKIRQIFLTHHTETMRADTELLLLFAGRVQHVGEVIKPALERGDWVICDRFTDASFAYQGAGRGIPYSHIAELANWAFGDFTPDMTLLLDAPVEIALQRLQQRSHKDRIEQEDIIFFQRVREGYLALAKASPARYRIVHAEQSQLQVQAQITALLDPLLQEYYV